MAERGLQEPPQQVSEALAALLLEADISLVKPGMERLETAIKLKAVGHPDIFGCMHYATALREDAILVTRDHGFIELLGSHGLGKGMTTVV